MNAAARQDAQETRIAALESRLADVVDAREDDDEPGLLGENADLEPRADLVGALAVRALVENAPTGTQFLERARKRGFGVALAVGRRFDRRAEVRRARGRRVAERRDLHRRRNGSGRGRAEHYDRKKSPHSQKSALSDQLNPGPPQTQESPQRALTVDILCPV